VVYLMGENPMLVEDAIEREFHALAEQRQEDAKLQQQRRPGSAVGQDAVLQERMAEVRRGERERAVAELMYLTLCGKFRRLKAPLVPTMKQGGYAHVVTSESAALSSEVFSREALELMRSTLAKSMVSAGGLPWDMESSLPVQMPLVSAGQLYATSMFFGHFLRQVDTRYQLEKRLGMLAGGGDSGGQTLEQYVKKFDQEELANMGKIGVLEAQLVTEINVQGLFGDLQQLKNTLMTVLQQGDVLDNQQAVEQRLQSAIRENKVPVLRFQTGELKRVLLEAVVFGGLLRDLMGELEGVYDLTPSEHSRLEPFGLEDGGPAGAGPFLPWLSR